MRLGPSPDARVRRVGGSGDVVVVARGQRLQAIASGLASTSLAMQSFGGFADGRTSYASALAVLAVLGAVLAWVMLRPVAIATVDGLVHNTQSLLPSRWTPWADVRIHGGVGHRRLSRVHDEKLVLGLDHGRHAGPRGERLDRSEGAKRIITAALAGGAEDVRPPPRRASTVTADGAAGESGHAADETGTEDHGSSGAAG